LLPRREAELFRPDEKAPIRVYRGPNHRERVVTDPKSAPCRRQIV
jgi:hypothetical protein